MVEGHLSDGTPLEARVFEWHTSNSGEEVQMEYRYLYPDMRWEGNTMFRDRFNHTLHGECSLEHLTYTFHDKHPLKEK